MRQSIFIILPHVATQPLSEILAFYEGSLIHIDQLDLLKLLERYDQFQAYEFYDAGTVNDS